MLGLSSIAQESFEAASSDSVFTSVEQMPQYVGGDAEMMKFISSHMHYPTIKDEDEMNCSRIVVKFVVSKRGKVRDITVIKGDANCAMPLVEVIEQMPDWIPGKQNGRPVDVYYSIPMYIHLQK